MTGYLFTVTSLNHLRDKFEITSVYVRQIVKRSRICREHIANISRTYQGGI